MIVFHCTSKFEFYAKSYAVDFVQFLYFVLKVHCSLFQILVKLFKIDQQFYWWRGTQTALDHCYEYRLFLCTSRPSCISGSDLANNIDNKNYIPHYIPACKYRVLLFRITDVIIKFVC